MLRAARCWQDFLSAQGSLHTSSTPLQEPKHRAFPTTEPLSLTMSIPAPECSRCSSLWQWLPKPEGRASQHPETPSLVRINMQSGFFWFHFPALFDSTQPGQSLAIYWGAPSTQALLCTLWNSRGLLQLEVALRNSTHTSCILPQHPGPCRAMKHLSLWIFLLSALGYCYNKESEILGFQYLNSRF